MSKMTCLWPSGVFYQALNTQKLVFGPVPRWGSLRHSPRPQSRLGRVTPPPHTLPHRHLRRLDLGAFGASVVRPPTQIHGYAYGLPNFFLAYSWPTLSKKPGAAPEDHRPMC